MSIRAVFGANLGNRTPAFVGAGTLPAHRGRVGKARFTIARVRFINLDGYLVVTCEFGVDEAEDSICWEKALIESLTLAEFERPAIAGASRHGTGTETNRVGAAGYQAHQKDCNDGK